MKEMNCEKKVEKKTWYWGYFSYMYKSKLGKFLFEIGYKYNFSMYYKVIINTGLNCQEKFNVSKPN